jgi:MFS family permease
MDPPHEDPQAARLTDRTLWTLLTGNALTNAGIGFFLPILPLYMSSRGGNSLLVGLVFSAGIVGQTLSQYPGGWLSDRLGHKPVIVGSSLAYAIVFPLYILPIPLPWLVALRFVHMLTAGAYTPAATAMVAQQGGARRGRAFALLRASSMVGIFVGPVFGGVIADASLSAVFVVGAVVSLAATVMMTRLPATQGSIPEPEGSSTSLRPLRILVILLPVILLSAPVYAAIGDYDTIWSLYITSKGATPFLVGLSFGAYAIPIVLLAAVAGTVADRWGHLRVGAVSTLLLGLFSALYPITSSIPLLLALNFMEGAFTIAGGPALQAAVADAAPPNGQGRAQGVYQTALLSTQVCGAIIGGALYHWRVDSAFFFIVATCVAGPIAGLALAQARR